MRNVLIGGGDSDTNAAITGGILGAYFGLSGIPKKFVDPVLSCDTAQNHVVPGVARPEFLRTCHLPELAKQLYEISKRVS